jgi:hypothetical protein
MVHFLTKAERIMRFNDVLVGVYDRRPKKGPMPPQRWCPIILSGRRQWPSP